MSRITAGQLASIYCKPGAIIAGIDEAGRGPLAGPVVAAAVVLPPNYSNPEINDSKQLTAAKREEQAVIIKQIALSWSWVAVGARRIEKLNILGATLLAMKLAAERTTANTFLIDGNQSFASDHQSYTLVKGDSLDISIAAASIIAKTARDQIMTQLDQRHSCYGFARHSGYPTKNHKLAISRHGICYLHRRTFKGVREYCSDLANLPLAD